jgi:CheY-like chemotaxis protein/predicted regulator of Ras-like GTPase activity (Roadblock/LC7/MglB family)
MAAARILLVEDDDTNAKLALAVLHQQGWSVARAATLQQALEAVAREPFDAAVLDYVLPDGSGIELLDVLREARPGIPVLFLTGMGSEQVARLAAELGAADYLQKDPGYARDLAERVRGLLDRAPDLAIAARTTVSGDSAPGPRLADVAAFRGLVDRWRARGALGAAVVDTQGAVLASAMPEGIEGAALGERVADLAHDAARLLRAQGTTSAPAWMFIAHGAGVVGVVLLPAGAAIVLALPPMPLDEASMALLHAAEEAAASGALS